MRKKTRKKIGVAKVKARNGVILEFDLRPPRDSIIHYPEGVVIAIIRRRGYIIKAHILRVRLIHGSFVYEGDVLSFSKIRRCGHVQESF